MLGIKSLAILTLIVNQAHCLIEGIYCGKENCYDVLGIDRTATSREVQKAYRKLARKYHPDSNPNDPDTSSKFILIATAYETLKDEEARLEYDAMLDNPDQFYRHYYRYYRRRSPNVDVRLVIVTLISVISAFQYYTSWYRYNEAINYLTTVAKYRKMAVEIGQQRGLLDDPANEKQKIKSREVKNGMKAYREEVIRNIVAENMQIEGGYRKPSWKRILWIQLFTWPYEQICCLVWLIKYYVNYVLLCKPLGREQKLYRIRKNFQMSESKFESINADEIESFLESKLWLKENFDAYKQEKEEEMKLNAANNAKLKKYRRWIRNHTGSGVASEF